MRIASVAKIFISWVVAGVLVAGGFLLLFRPLAGLTLLIFVMGAIIISVAPIAHITLLWRQERRGTTAPKGVVWYVVAGLVVVFLVLAFSGYFDFT